MGAQALAGSYFRPITPIASAVRFYPASPQALSLGGASESAPTRMAVIAPSLAPLRQMGRALLRAALVAAALRGAGAQYCPPGAATVCDAVLVVCADDAPYCADVRSNLLATRAFATVEFFDATSGTPTAE